MTVCHSKTPDIPSHLRDADVVVVAVGKPLFVKGEWLKPGAVVLDVGMNSIPDETKKTKQRYGRHRITGGGGARWARRENAALRSGVGRDGAER